MKNINIHIYIMCNAIFLRVWLGMKRTKEDHNMTDVYCVSHKLAVNWEEIDGNNFSFATTTTWLHILVPKRKITWSQQELLNHGILQDCFWLAVFLCSIENGKGQSKNWIFVVANQMEVCTSNRLWCKILVLKPYTVQKREEGKEILLTKYLCNDHLEVICII